MGFSNKVLHQGDAEDEGKVYREGKISVSNSQAIEISINSGCLFGVVNLARYAHLLGVFRVGYLLLWWAMGLGSLSGHVVEQLYSEWKETDEGWVLEIQFDAGYAVPETRDDPYEPALKRRWLREQSEEVWSDLQGEAESYLSKMLVLKANGRELEWEVKFPDWEASPPDFPKLLNGIAYFRAVIEGEDPGRIAVGVQEGSFPKLVVEKEGKYLVLAPGETKELREGGRWGVWLREGYRHVVPEGLDHVLFVFGLFFYRRKILELVHQSLAFTVAHSLTLGLAAAGWVVLPESWSGPLEILIALSLVLVGIENLRSERKLKVRLVLVFLLGLLHGLGFAGALANYIDSDELVASVAGMNVGVELAQISLLAVAWVLTLKWHEKEIYEKGRWAGSIAVALAGVFWAVTRFWALVF